MPFTNAPSPQATMENGDVKRRVVKGFAANVCNQGVTAVVQLAGVPILLHAWGVDLYGEWLILFAIPAYLSMTDLGFSQSAANDMTAQVARGEYQAAVAVFQSLIALVFTALVCMLFLITVTLYALPIDHWWHLSGMTGSETRWTLWFLAAAVLAQLPDGINHAGFRAGGDYAFHVLLHSGVRLSQFGVVWVVALSGGGTVPAAAAFFVVRVLATSAFAFLVLRRHSWLKYDVNQARLAEIMRLFRPALANVAVPLAQGLNIQGMVLAVGAVLGPVAVVTFSTLRTLTRLVLQLVYSVSHAAEPEVASAYGSGNRPLLRSLFLHSLNVSFWLALLASICLFLLGNPLLSLWTHGKVRMEPLLFVFLLISALISVLWYGGFMVLKATNQHLRASVVFVLSSAVAVGLAIVLMNRTCTVVGAGIALLVSDTAMIIYTFRRTVGYISTKRSISKNGVHA